MAYRYIPPRADVGNGIDDFGGAKLYFYDFGTLNAKTVYSDFALTTPAPLVGGAVEADADGLFPNIYLDIKASVTLKTSNNVIIFGPEKIYAPDDSISALAASVVSVLDSGGNFTASNVEAVLSEIASGYLRANRSSTISADQNFSADLKMADNVIERPEIKDFSLTHTSPTSSANALELDINNGNSFYHLLTENTTITLSNPSPSGSLCQIIVRIQQDGGGGGYTVTWPSSVDWSGASAPTMTASNDAVDKYTLTTDDGGTTWYGEFGQAYG